MLERFNRWRAWLQPRRTAVRLLSNSQGKVRQLEQEVAEQTLTLSQLMNDVQQRDADLRAAGERFRESLREVDELKSRLVKSQRKVREMRQRERDAVHSSDAYNRECAALRQDLETTTAERDRLQARLELAEIQVEGLEAWRQTELARMDTEAAILARKRQNALHSERIDEDGT